MLLHHTQLLEGVLGWLLLWGGAAFVGSGLASMQKARVAVHLHSSRLLLALIVYFCPAALAE